MNVDVSPKQRAYIEARHRYLCYSGCFRGGKSIALCHKLLMRASNPKATEGLCRKTFKSLRGSTLDLLLHGTGDVPAILPPGSYEYKQDRFTIYLKKGGRIIVFGLDDPTNIQGYTFTGCAIDEATQLDENDWRTVDSRVSTSIEGLGRQTYAACNPGPPDHFLCKMFGFAGMHPRDGARVLRAEDGTEFWGQLTAAYENPFLAPDVLRDLARMTGTSRKRYYEGLWVGSEGLVYDDWDQNRHVRTIDKEWPRVVVSADDGTRDPFVALRLCIDDGHVHVEREFYKSGVLVTRKVNVVQEFAQGAEAVVYDSAALHLGEELRNVGLPVRPSKKKKDEGITKVQQRLADGTLSVDPSCVNLIREIQSYEWKPGTETPQDGNDHCLDALRYGIMQIDSRTVNGVWAAGGRAPRAGAHALAGLCRREGETLDAYTARQREAAEKFIEKQRGTGDARQWIERLREDPNWGFR
jgi:PBSX family phage terminase large subunit